MLQFNMQRMGTELGGWTKKGGTAAEYKSAGSNYRTYKPTVSNTPGGGLLATTKLDHIRGWAQDDHNQLDMEFDPYGRLVSVRSIMNIQGTPQFDTGLIKAAADLYDDQAGQIAEVGAKIVNSLVTFVTDLNEHGGRANFPAVVRHNFNLIATSVSGPQGTVQGAIRDKWVALGSEQGFLGYPLTDETPTPDSIGRYNHFQGGSIYWTRKRARMRCTA